MPDLRGGVPEDGGLTRRAMSRAARRTSRLAAAAFVFAACDTQPETVIEDTAAPAVAHAVHDEADKEFLGLMIGHHAGMVAIAEAAMASTTGQARSDAETVRRKQAAERDSMSAILSNRYATMITPAVSESARFMADSLKRLPAAAAGHAFYDMTIRHHQEGIAMVDEYVPRLSPMISAMASGMKTDQTAEAAEFQRKAGDVH